MTAQHLQSLFSGGHWDIRVHTQVCCIWSIFLSHLTGGKDMWQGCNLIFHEVHQLFHFYRRFSCPLFSWKTVRRLSHKYKCVNCFSGPHSYGATPAQPTFIAHLHFLGVNSLQLSICTPPFLSQPFGFSSISKTPCHTTGLQDNDSALRSQNTASPLNVHCTNLNIWKGFRGNVFVGANFFMNRQRQPFSGPTCTGEITAVDSQVLIKYDQQSSLLISSFLPCRCSGNVTQCTTIV